MQRSSSDNNQSSYERSSASSGGSHGAIASGLLRSLPPSPPSLLPGRTVGDLSHTRRNPTVSPPPTIVTVGRHTLIAPNSKLARAIVMGNDASTSRSPNNIDAIHSRHHSSGSATPPCNVVPAVVVATGSSSPNRQNHQQSRPLSNLTVLLNQQNDETSSNQRYLSSEYHVPLNDNSSDTNHFHETLASSSSAVSPSCIDEADSASGPPPLSTRALGRSAPDISGLHMLPIPPPPPLPQQAQFTAHRPSQLQPSADVVRRCMSSKELGGTLAPPSGSPYAYLLHKKEELEVLMRNRLVALRQADVLLEGASQSEVDKTSSTNTSRKNSWDNENSTSASSRSMQHESANEMRNRRRAQHAKAVVDDLCHVVSDLFIAESKLLNPRNYGLQQIEDSGVTTSNSKTFEREQVIRTIQSFVSSLPLRYALSAETPSEVLLHMRLMAAVRSDSTKAVLHIHNMEDNCNWGQAVTAATRQKCCLRLVTISCHDCTGLLEYISKLLASSGSRVLDADVMLSTDGIVLDRFVVEMTGRLRLDKMVNLVEAFLRQGSEHTVQSTGVANSTELKCSSRSDVSSPAPAEVNGPLYVPTMESPVVRLSYQSQEQDIKSGIPLAQVLASNNEASLAGLSVPTLRKMHSLPSCISYHSGRIQQQDEHAEVVAGDEQPNESFVAREKRPLINRRGLSNLDGRADSFGDLSELDFVSVPVVDASMGALAESRDVPLIPFHELMLIETIGTGRASTIYRAAWQRGHFVQSHPADTAPVRMVALKVAMVNALTGDTAHVDELRREADIAARLDHPNICDLVGVAVDPECFCLAYEYCEGGSLLSLLSDTTRYYEYLPIALDIVQGMAFLHMSSVIHRDLKPSNILLTRDHRAKIADFGMSVKNHGQELTAETGTYRYMAPEVIRHESYSSNADVYSFGLCLWQLITREIPFATMTPIQAAYAVAEGNRPVIPPSTPQRLQEIIRACWDQDSHRRPSFTYIAMALADYAKMAFSPANVGTLTLQIANEMLATVEGNSTVNVDFSTPVAPPLQPPPLNYLNLDFARNDSFSNLGLEIE